MQPRHLLPSKTQGLGQVTEGPRAHNAPMQQSKWKQGFEVNAVFIYQTWETTLHDKIEKGASGQTGCRTE